MVASIINLYAKVSTSKIQASLTALLVFLLPFERIPSLDVSGITLRLSQFVALALIFVSMKAIYEFYRTRPHLPRLLLPAFLGSYLLSMLLANDLKRATTVFVFTVFVALVASVIAATLSANQLPRLEKYLYATTVVVLAFGFYQYIGDVMGINPAFTGLRAIYVKEIFGFTRIQSTALEPLYYGSFLLIPYCLLLARHLIQSRKTAITHNILMMLVVVQLLLTVSRGAIYGGVMATIVLIGYLSVSKKTTVRRVAAVAGMLVAAALAAIALTWLSSYFVKDKKIDAGKKTTKLIEQTGNFDSQDDRVRNRTIAIQVFKEQPVLGIGPGGFSSYAVTIYPPYAKQAPIIVNNEPLELAAEAGIIGLGLFVLFTGWSYVAVAGKYLTSKFKNQAAKYWVPAILVYVIALAIQYQTFSTLYVMHVWVIIGLLMAFGKPGKLITK